MGWNYIKFHPIFHLFFCCLGFVVLGLVIGVLYGFVA